MWKISIFFHLFPSSPQSPPLQTPKQSLIVMGLGTPCTPLFTVTLANKKNLKKLCSNKIQTIYVRTW
jgi:hypothetical protein